MLKLKEIAAPSATPEARVVQAGDTQVKTYADTMRRVETKTSRTYRTRENTESSKRFRAARIDSKVDDASRSVELSFSSETNTVQRYCYELGGAVPEILSHRDGAADFLPLLEAGSVLRNHDPNQIIGVPESVRIDDLRGKAKIRFGNSTLANETLQDVKDGILRGVSFGYEPLSEEHIKAGETNAEGVKGPCIFVRHWRALEISLTPIPADATVGVGRAASAALNKENAMKRKRADGTEYDDEDPKVKAAEELAKKASEEMAKKEAEDLAKKAEEDAKKKEDDEKKNEKSTEALVTRALKAAKARHTEIRTAVRIAGLGDEFADDLVEREVSIDAANAAVIAELGKTSPAPFRPSGRESHISMGQGRNEKLQRHLIVNIGRRCGIRDDADKDVELQPMRLADLGRSYLEMIGFPGTRSMTNEEIARAAFSPDAKFRAVANNSTASLASILANVQNKVLLRAYKKAEATWKKWCRMTSIPDFKLLSRLRISDFADLKETGENGEIADSQIIDSNETFRLAYYARMISLTWQMFINDDLDALSRLPAMMGQSAARLPSRLGYLHLLANGNMSDGTPLFHADHNNLDATAAAMDAAGVQRAITKFRKQTSFQAPNDPDFAPEPLDINPAYLIVPPELEFTAKKLIWSPADVAATYSAGVVNPIKGILKDVIVESRLSNPSYAGYSTTAYYTVGDPEEIDTLEIGFLDGNEQPRTDTWENFERLAIQFRAILPCVAKAVDTKGMVKSNGA